MKAPAQLWLTFLINNICIKAGYQPQLHQLTLKKWCSSCRVAAELSHLGVCQLTALGSATSLVVLGVLYKDCRLSKGHVLLSGCTDSLQQHIHCQLLSLVHASAVTNSHSYLSVASVHHLVNFDYVCELSL